MRVDIVGVLKLRFDWIGKIGFEIDLSILINRVIRLIVFGFSFSLL